MGACTATVGFLEGGPAAFIHLRYSAVRAVEDLSQAVHCPCPNVPLCSAGAQSRDLARGGCVLLALPRLLLEPVGLSSEEENEMGILLIKGESN